MGNKPKSILKKQKAAIPADFEEVAASAAVPEAEVELEGLDQDDQSDDLDEVDNDSFGELSDSEEETDSDEDDEDMIRALQDGGERPAKKLKHTTLRPKPAAEFSSALTHLLSLPPTTSAPQPKNAPPSAHSQRLERRAKSLIRQTKAEHFDRGHVRDVIAGWAARPALPFSQWESASARRFAKARAGLTAGEEHLVDETGAEREKRLRKLAQRGVVRLFNAIGAAQGAPIRAEEESRKRLRGEEVGSEAGEQRALGPGESIGPGGKVTRRPNVLGGRGKGEALTNLSKASFLDLIRAGTTSAPMVKTR